MKRKVTSSILVLVCTCVLAVVVYASESFKGVTLSSLQVADYSFAECLNELETLTEYAASSRVNNIEDLIDTYEDIQESLRDAIDTIEDTSATIVDDERESTMAVVLSMVSSSKICSNFVELYKNLEELDDYSAEIGAARTEATANLHVALSVSE
ncbi:MAG: hypothetical protein OXG24_05425 [Gammaproteobacteria bacterium]|nr:hypothetical protein [Gammaproteobacteria bacterium]